MRRAADALELERTSLYRAIATLERGGLVSSGVDPNDARVKRAKLTPSGEAKIAEILPHWRRAQESFLAAVGPAEWAAVAERLDGLRSDMATDPLVQRQLHGIEP